MERLLDILPAADGSTRVEVWEVSIPDAERSVQLRFAVFSDALGWTTQRRIDLGDAQAAGLRNTIGMFGFDGTTTRKAKLASLPVESGNVVRLEDARALLG